MPASAASTTQVIWRSIRGRTSAPCCSSSKASRTLTVPTYGVRIGVTFRKSGTHFESAGDCSSIHDNAEAGKTAGVAHCGVDCDGGSIDVAIKDAKSVWSRFRTAPASGVPAATWASRRIRASVSAADDKVFRLDKVALNECLSLADDNKEKAAMRRGQ